MGFTLPAALLPPRCALTAPFHPYPTEIRRINVTSQMGGIVFCGTFRKTRLSEFPRPLAGMLPYGDRTFLPSESRKGLLGAIAHPASPYLLWGGRRADGNRGGEASGQRIKT